MWNILALRYGFSNDFVSQVTGRSDPLTYPFENNKDTGINEDFLINMRKYPYFRARNKYIASMLRVRSQVIK